MSDGAHYRYQTMISRWYSTWTRSLLCSPVFSSQTMDDIITFTRSIQAQEAQDSRNGRRDPNAILCAYIPNSQSFHYLCTSGNSKGTLGWSNCSKRCSRLSYLAICLYFFVCMLLSARKSNTDIPWYKMTNNCLGNNVWVGPNLVVISYKDEWNLPTRSTSFFSEIEIATCWCVYCAKSINTPSSWELHLRAASQ